jgi:hypothetical protein
VASQGQRGRGRDQPAHPADRGDQLGDRVLGGDRAVQQGGIQRPAGAAGKHPGGVHHLTDRVEDPLRPLGGAQPRPPQGQHAGVEARVGERQPAGDLLGDVAGQLLAGLPVRQAFQRLQHHHGSDDVSGNRGPASARGEQIGEQLVGEQRSAVVGEEGVHGAVGDQMTAVCLGVEELNTGRVSNPLHARKSVEPSQQTRIAQQAPSDANRPPA